MMKKHGTSMRDPSAPSCGARPSKIKCTCKERERENKTEEKTEKRKRMKVLDDTPLQCRGFSSLLEQTTPNPDPHSSLASILGARSS